MVKEKITIIGGGIGGLTLANACLKNGIDFELFEATKNYDNVGGGHWLYANALRTLDGIDPTIVDDFRTLGHEFEGFLFSDLKQKTIVEKKVEQFVLNPRYSPLVLHRADIIRILAKRIPTHKISFDKRLKQIESNNLVFEDGSHVKFQILIGADGIHSKVRRLIRRNPIHPLDSGQVGIWGISKAKLPTHYGNKFMEIWGDGKRVGLTDVGGGNIYWFMVLKKKHIPDKTSNIKAFLEENGKTFPKDLMAIILNSEQSTIKFNPLFDMPIVSKWYKGNICCIGDSIHACTPNLGQGGCQAIEDGYWLAEMLVTHKNTERAFKNFQKKRKLKAVTVVLLSRWLGKLAQSEGYINMNIRNNSAKNHPKRIVNYLLNWIMNVNSNSFKNQV